MTLVQVRTLRQSTMGTADICLHRLDHMFNPDTPRKGSVMRSIGTGYHAGIAEYYVRRRAKDLYHQSVTPEPFEVDEFVHAAIEAFDADVAENDLFDWRFQPKVVYTPADAHRAVEAAVRRYFDEERWWPSHYEVLAVELSFTLPYPGTDGWTRHGTIDLVLLNAEDGWHQIVDQKLSRKRWDKKKGGPNNAQAAWYIQAWREYAAHPYVSFIYDIISLDGEFDRRPAVRSEEQIWATLERGRMLTQLLDQGGPFPPNPSSFLCSEAYCDYWDQCAFGKTLA